MNEQLISKKINEPWLLVHSIFKSVQGEGPFSGTPAVFVRLAGCNLCCPHCDTDYTSVARTMMVNEVMRDIEQFPDVAPDGAVRLIVITGGEPFRQARVNELAYRLARLGYFVQFETNGTLPIGTLADIAETDIQKRKGVYVVCSPKSSKLSKDMDHACAFKYVIEAGKVNPQDGLPTKVLGNRRAPARPPKDFKGPIYVQPMDEQGVPSGRDHLVQTLDSCLRYGYILQLQIHKIIGVQ